MLNILVITPSLPRPDVNAGDRRLDALLAMMARKHRVSVCPGSALDPRSDRDATARLVALGVHVKPIRSPNTSRALLDERYDLIIFEFFKMAALFGRNARLFQPRAAVLVDSVDVHFARERAAADLGLMDREVVESNRIVELQTYRRSDAVIVVTEPDRLLLEAEGAMPPLPVIPLVLPIQPRRLDPRGQNVLFIGGFGHLPNIDGLLWFARSCWPLIRVKVPGAALNVIGSKPPPEIQALDGIDGIRVLGFVADTAPCLDSAAVSIAPLRYGAGMKGKVVEALAGGLPLVTTSIGIQGIGGEPGQDYLLADEAQAFASAVVDLLQNPQRAQRIGLAGQQNVAAQFTPEAVSKALDRMLESLAPPPAGLWQKVRWNARAMLARPLVIGGGWLKRLLSR